MSELSIEIFRCPVTGSAVVAATATELAGFNAWLAGQPARVLGDGTKLPACWPAAWKTCGTGRPCIWYPLVDGIPVLVPDAATEWAGTAG